MFLPCNLTQLLEMWIAFLGISSSISMDCSHQHLNAISRKAREKCVDIAEDADNSLFSWMWNKLSHLCYLSIFFLNEKGKGAGDWETSRGTLELKLCSFKNKSCWRFENWEWDQSWRILLSISLGNKWFWISHFPDTNFRIPQEAESAQHLASGNLISLVNLQLGTLNCFLLLRSIKKLLLSFWEVLVFVNMPSGK